MKTMKTTKTMSKQFSIGLDFGSSSVRCLIIDVVNGDEYGVDVFNYPSGEEGVLTDPDNHLVARQNPRDFIDGLIQTCRNALKEATSKDDFTVEQIVGIGIDATGSTPIPVDTDLTPLAFQEAFKDNLNAQAWMWKDHSAVDEAEKISELAEANCPDCLAKCGGTFSSEWLFSKIWHCLNCDRDVFNAAYAWIEFADFIPAMLGGVKSLDDLKINICSAGHKAMYNDDWGGYPSADFLSLLDPLIADLMERYPKKAVSIDNIAAHLSNEWSETLGLPAGLPIAVGAIDAHLGAVGAGVSPGRMVKVIGTSTCDMLVGDGTVEDIPGVCGIVEGSIIPGLTAIEAGQSAVGDIFNWFVKNICKGDNELFSELSEEAERLEPGESGLMALDWQNGNRCILIDARLSGLIVGMNLHTSQAEIYRALIEATAFGSKAIIDRIEEYGVEINEIICCGGIAEKSPLFMQIYADVLNKTMRISASSQTCALGSAIAGAVVAGVYDSVQDAQENICAFKDLEYKPIADHNEKYQKLYILYKELHDSFGVKGSHFDHSKLMKELMRLKN
ncbi:MAG: ribulokinase [Lentisphaeria bacterium]|nr:ribulokinase [Lentisphaeria bacterium]